MSNSCNSVSIFTGFEQFFVVLFYLISPDFKSGYFHVNEIGRKITSVSATGRRWNGVINGKLQLLNAACHPMWVY